jgi:hypothetical protein
LKKGKKVMEMKVNYWWQSGENFSERKEREERGKEERRIQRDKNQERRLGGEREDREGKRRKRKT